MTQCAALARRTDRRCENEAAEGLEKCELHDNMPSNWKAVGELKEQAYRLGHVAISRGQYVDLLNIKERYEQMQESR